MTIAIVFAISSCTPPETSYRLRITNDSSHTIYIKPIQNNGRCAECYVLSPKEYLTTSYDNLMLISAYVINYDGKVTTLDNEDVPNSLFSFGICCLAYDPILIEDNVYTFEYVFTDAHYEYALAHPFDHWDEEDWTGLIPHRY